MTKIEKKVPKVTGVPKMPGVPKVKRTYNSKYSKL